jgi:hypothetical protein
MAAKRHETTGNSFLDTRFFSEKNGLGRQGQAHRIGRYQFNDGDVSTSLGSFHFSKNAGPNARAIHLDIDMVSLPEVKKILMQRGLRQKGDRMHEVKLAQGGGGINILLSPAPLNPESTVNVDFDGKND